MISIIQEKFASDIADKITRFLEHPTAHMIKELKRYTDLLTFDTHNDWHKWQSVGRMTKLAGTNRGYVPSHHSARFRYQYLLRPRCPTHTRAS